MSLGLARCEPRTPKECHGSLHSGGRESRGALGLLKMETFLPKRTASAIGKANRAKGHRGNSVVSKLLAALMDRQAHIVHRASGDPQGADIMMASGSVGVQVKSMRSLPVSVLSCLSDDGAGVMLADDGDMVALVRIPR